MSHNAECAEVKDDGGLAARRRSAPNPLAQGPDKATNNLSGLALGRSGPDQDSGWRNQGRLSIERQNARLRCTLAERGLDGAFRAGHSAALGIALSALTGDEFTRAR